MPRDNDDDEDVPERNDQTDYVVGFGRPPKQHRFKPGESGNSRGRPKGAANTRAILMKIANQKMSVKVGGRIRQMAKKEALIELDFQKALSVDATARKRLIEILLALDKSDRPSSGEGDRRPDAEHMRKLRESLTRRLSDIGDRLKQDDFPVSPKSKPQQAD